MSARTPQMYELRRPVQAQSSLNTNVSRSRAHRTCTACGQTSILNSAEPITNVSVSGSYGCRCYEENPLGLYNFRFTIAPPSHDTYSGAEHPFTPYSLKDTLWHIILGPSHWRGGCQDSCAKTSNNAAPKIGELRTASHNYTRHTID